jgi:hypothetical protein
MIVKNQVAGKILSSCYIDGSDAFFRQRVWRNVKTPNKACSGRRGVGAIYERFLGFKLFLLSGFYLRPPLVRR